MLEIFQPNLPAEDSDATNDVPAAPTKAPPPAAPAGAAKAPYPPPATVPTQSGPQRIRFDFNLGARVVLPTRAEGQWRIRLRDLDSGNVLFQSDNTGAFVNSSKRWFIRFGVEVWDLAAAADAPPVFTHEYDARDREVLIQFPIGTLGDTLAWMPYAARFAAAHGARVTCAMSALIIPILGDAYPHIRFVTHEELVEQALADRFYATYSLGLFFDDVACDWQPTDFRHVGLHRTAGYILGTSPDEEPSRLVLPDESRPIAEPYVCIAVQSSSGAKYWNNPTGWRDVVAFLKQAGYRVICIDQKPVHGAGLVWTHIPHGVEDHTGNLPLAERARWLRHASAFVGLSSGLAWLAWAAGCPVVLISGFTHPTNEFATPFRVINWHVCNSCWNDPRVRFDHHDFLWCPRHANTPRQFECSRLITSAQVIETIRRINAFATSAGPSSTPTAPPEECPP